MKRRGFLRALSGLPLLACLAPTAKPVKESHCVPEAGLCDCGKNCAIVTGTTDCVPTLSTITLGGATYTPYRGSGT